MAFAYCCLDMLFSRQMSDFSLLHGKWNKQKCEQLSQIVWRFIIWLTLIYHTIVFMSASDEIIDYILLVFFTNVIIKYYQFLIVIGQPRHWNYFVITRFNDLVISFITYWLKCSYKALVFWLFSIPGLELNFFVY